MTRPEAAAVAETHSAVLFFWGDQAIKVKKPVDLGFLDFRTREAREAICHQEVALNRRLAPDVYTGVADVIGPDGAPCEHLIVMRRMPAERRLSTLVGAGVDVGDALRLVARRIAALHGRSARSPAIDEAAGIEATRRRWQANTDDLIHRAPGLLDEETIGAVHGLACRYLDGRTALFARRIADGRAVDGHGDLLADDIFCLDDGPRILDCIEFDDSLRFGDGLADAAFLAMDLEHLGHPTLARLFLDAYREDTADSWPASLEHHLVAYRAQVRAKVAAIRAEQGDDRGVDEARLLLQQARAHLEAGRVRLVLVGGLPGTGKSTLAMGLERTLGWTVLRSDQLRKELGTGPTWTQGEEDFGRGLYDHETTGRTYGRLLAEARIALGLGESVVLDASWTDPEQRAAARTLGRELHADVIELRMDLPEDVAIERMRARASAGDDPSDASPAIAALLAARAQPWPEAHRIDGTDAAAALAAATMVVSPAGPRG